MPTPNALAAAVAPVAQAIEAAVPVAVTARRSWYAINKQPTPTGDVEIKIYEEIGAWGVTAEQFVNELNAITAPRITLRLNTPGGEVFDGTAIHNAIREHPAHITAKVDGLAASCGSFIAVAADEVQVAHNAYMMVHEASGGVMGTAEDMTDYAAVLEKINGNIAAMYAKRSGRKVAEWRQMMADETWFTADEAVAAGLADSVTAEEAKPSKAAASFDFTVYNKIPDSARPLLGLPPTQPAPSATLPVSPPPAGHETNPTVTSPAAPLESVPEEATTERTSAMSDPITATPAAPSAAANGPTLTEAESRHKELVQLNAKAIETCTEQGRVKGVVQGREQELERAKAIADVCPGKPEMALTAILNGSNPAAVKMAFDAAVMAETRGKTENDALQAEIARWKALAHIGGHSGVNASPSNPDDDERPTMEPKAQAEWEWENRPSVRKTASTKDIYVIARTAELNGTHRSFSREAASA